MSSISSLSYLCILSLTDHIKEITINYSHYINELCKILILYPHLLELLFDILINKNVITDVALIQFLISNRYQLICPNITHIKNSTLKMIGYNCINLITLNLTNCYQVTNGVVRSVLHGCHQLKELILNHCYRITDSAFDPSASPFELLYGCFTLETLSLQGCNQITGSLANLLSKQCHQLQNLNLSQCKRISTPELQNIFSLQELKSLNLLFTDLINDEAFSLLPLNSSCSNTNTNSNSNSNETEIETVNKTEYYINTNMTRNVNVNNSNFSDQIKQEDTSFHSIECLLIGRSLITDETLFRLTSLHNLIEINLQWCLNITDIGIKSLVSNCKKLEIINLKSCNQLTDLSIQAICLYCSNITYLDVSWCSELTDISIYYIITKYKEDNISLSSSSSLSNNLYLKNLYLSWCPLITNESIECLCNELKFLCTLDISGCLNITTDCIERIKTKNIQINI